MKLDFDKYNILRMQHEAVVNPVQVRELGDRQLTHILMEKTSRALADAIVNKFTRIERMESLDLVTVRCDCFVVSYEDARRMMIDAYAAGLRSKDFWHRYEVGNKVPTMED